MTTEYELSQLKLAADAERSGQLAAAWRKVAGDLAQALRISGWTQTSGGRDALDAYDRLLRADMEVSLQPQPLVKN